MKGRWPVKQHAEKEISEPTLLCDKKGNLNPKAIGYARKPLIESNLKGHYMRKKSGIIGVFLGMIFFFLQLSAI